jgi:WD40 repeat protein
VSYVINLCWWLLPLLLWSCSSVVLSTVAASPDGKIIVAAGPIAGKPVINLYDPTTLEELRGLRAEKEKTLKGKTGAVFDRRPMAISFDSRFLAATGRIHSVDVWELSSGRQVVHLPQLAGAIALAFSPTANILAVAGPASETTVWSVPDGKVLAVLRGRPTSPNTAVAFSPDGKILAVGNADRVVRLWSLADGRELRVLEDHDGWVHSLSFSPDGKMLAAYALRLKFWHLPEMNPIPVFPELGDIGTTSTGGHPGIFSPNGKFFAYFRTYVTYLLGLEDYAREVVILNFESKKEIRIACGCLSFTISSDGSKIITVAADTVEASPIRTWNPLTGQRVK